MPAECAAAPEDPIEIDVDDIEPAFVGRILRRNLGARDAGVADENVDPSLLRHHPLRGAVDLGGVRHVHLDNVGRVALRLHRRLRFSRPFRIVVGDIDMRASLRERLDAGEPDPLPAAGDDRDAALEIESIEIHRAVSG